MAALAEGVDVRHDGALRKKKNQQKTEAGI
jgi:hypothetical protein